MTMILELRDYTAAPGKLPALVSRFSVHNTRLFARHGLEIVYFGTDCTGDEPDLFSYGLSFESLDHRIAAWTAFLADPQWHQVKRETEQDGPLTAGITSHLITAIDH